jgi:hypothetical protein
MLPTQFILRKTIKSKYAFRVTVNIDGTLKYRCRLVTLVVVILRSLDKIMMKHSHEQQNIDPSVYCFT